ncbi:MAG: adenylyltransferase/cytidyltransferase family protein [Chitinispirillaceae bacterium]|nr:adenylyltransferase/cytidyltransferase family protein [Chitinispirillaceae bacterium]
MFERIKAKILTIKTLNTVRSGHPDKKIVFCSGCYDILQSGHAVFFDQCKEFGDILVVGIGRDNVISELKGPGRPVNPENNRLYLVAAMHDVDYAVLNSDILLTGKMDHAPVLENLRPDIYVLNSDDSDIMTKRELCNRLGVEIRFVERVVPLELEPTSSTRIIDKINFSYKAPLRIDFAGGWADVPYIMHGTPGFVTNVAIKPLIEYKSGAFNFSGYPRGSGLSTSTAAKLLEMISAKTYNSEAKTLSAIAEDLFTLENRELNWAIGRQDQYGIVYGGMHCFEFGPDYGNVIGGEIPGEILERFKEKLVLIHTGISRNAQVAVEQVYKSHATPEGKNALAVISECGRLFFDAISAGDFIRCAGIMERNFEAQKELAPASSSPRLDEMYAYAKEHGAYGGKICGAGGGGAFVFYTKDPQLLITSLKEKFVDCFEIDFAFEYKTIKQLNTI